MTRRLLTLIAIAFILLPLEITGLRLHPEPTGARAAGTSTSVRAAGSALEVVSRRTRTTRVYLQDGHYVAHVSAASQNYQDAQGAWQPIDDSLIPSTVSGFTWQTKANRYTALFPSSLNQPVRVQIGSSWVQFSLNGGSANGSTSGTTATYPLTGGSLSLTATPDELKEAITLSSASAPASYTFLLQSSGLTARANAKGGIDLLDAASAVVSTLAAPLVYEQQHPENVSTKVSLTLGQSSSGQTVTLAVDPTWLSAPGRSFPVVIDPSVMLASTLVCSVDQAGNVGTCGGQQTIGGTSNLGSLLHFDVSSLPAGAQILDADVTLYQATAFPSASDVGTYQALQAGSPITWAPASGDGMCSPTSCDLPATSIVQNWVYGEANYGLLLRMVTAGTGSTITFTPSNALLTVTYIPVRLGLEGWDTTNSEGLTDALSSDVNVASGNLVLSAGSFSIPTVGISLSIGEQYNSLDPSTYSFGNRPWRLNTGTDVRLTAYSDGSAAVSLPNGDTRAFAHHSDGTFTPPHGVHATLANDGTNATLTFRNGLIYTFPSPAAGSSAGLTSVTDQNGNGLTYTYNVDGTLASISSSGSVLATFTYGSAAGSTVVTQIKDKANRIWSFGYNASGYLSSITDNTNATTQFSYNAAGRLNGVTDPRGGITQFTLDGSGRVTAVTRGVGATWNGQSIQAATTLSYNQGATSCPAGIGASDATTVTDANNHTTRECTDTRQRVVAETDPLNHTSQMTWNTDYHPLTETLPSGKSVSYTYDSYYRLQSEQWANGATQGPHVQWGYDTTPPTGTLVWMYQPITFTDAQGNVTHYTYDTAGNLKTLQDARNATTQYTYNANGTLDHVTDASNHTTNYAYNGPNGLLSTVTPPSPLGATSLTYTSFNDVSTTTDGKGQTSTFTYDGVGRELAISHPDGTSASTAYDANGNVVTNGDSTGTSSFQYDARNRLMAEQHPDTQSTSFSYDAAGNLLSKTVTQQTSGGTTSSSSTSYGYDAADQLTAVTDAAGTITLGYDVDGNQTQVTYPGGASESTHYNDFSQLDRIWGSNSGGGQLTNFTYSYLNPTTNLTTAQRYSVTDTANRITSYTYDGDNQLTGATQTSGGAQVASYAYQYDQVGNITSTTRNGTATTMTYNAADELNQTTTGNSAITFSFDGNGNLTGASGRLHAWYNRFDQTSGLAGPTGNGMSTIYRGAGQSARVGAGGQTYQYDATGLNGMGTNAPNGSAALTAGYTVQGQPASWPAGSTATETVTVTNTGTAAWQSGVHLGIHFSRGGGGYANANGGANWATDQRYAVPSLAPGASATVTVSVTAPSTSGTYAVEYEMEQDGPPVTWSTQFLDSPGTVTTLTASVNPVVTSSSGSTVISFDTGDGSTGQVYVSANGGAEALFTQGASGAGTAPWIQAGVSYTFTLYQGTGHTTVLNRVTVLGASGAAITATLAPVAMPFTSSTIAWSTGDGSTGQVYVSANGGPESLFAQAANGPGVAPWLQPGNVYAFKLYAGTLHLTLLGQTTVAMPTISAAPTVVATGGGSGSSTISWNGEEGTTEQVYVSANGGPETLVGQGASGSVTPNWITDGFVYTFTLYQGTSHLLALGQVVVASVTTDTIGPAPTTPPGAVGVTTTPDGEVLDLRSSAGTVYLLHDGIGSVVAVITGSGQMRNQYSYDPYGNVTTASETVANPFRFAGGMWDPVTGLYKFGERYYDPTVGRFTQLDPLGGGFVYANNNPINSVDPTGLSTYDEYQDQEREFEGLGGPGPIGVPESNGGDPEGEKCSFSADTLVDTPHGEVPISSIKPGDQVIAYDQATQTTGVYTVTATWAHNDGEVEYLTIGGETVTTTPEHPFYTQEHGWLPAGQLKTGDHVRTRTGQYVVVPHILLLKKSQEMFNLTVEHAHTYFVGTSSILVHNSCKNFEHFPSKKLGKRTARNQSEGKKQPIHHPRDRNAPADQGHYHAVDASGKKRPKHYTYTRLPGETQVNGSYRRT